MNNEVKIVSATENWSEYKFEDGTTMKVKPIITKIIKTDEKKSDGTPIYNIKFQLAVDYDKE